MPHVNIKCYPGKTKEEKEKLAERITKDIMEVFDVGEDGISIAFQEIKKEDWENEVWKKDIIGKKELLYKKPGYSFE